MRDIEVARARRTPFVAQTLVSAAPRLVSARLTDNFPTHTREFFRPGDTSLLWISHAAAWHLHGSLPHGRYPPPGKASAGKAFIWMDRHLDCASTGPFFLRQPSVARLVVDALYRGVALGHYDPGAFVVMANQVHILVLPKISPSRLLQSMQVLPRARRI